jgi:hypothetical protein
MYRVFVCLFAGLLVSLFAHLCLFDVYMSKNTHVNAQFRALAACVDSLVRCEANLQIYACVLIFLCMYVCKCAYCMRMCICMCICICACICVCIYIYIYIHIHIFNP